jgi:hypothetical protein
MFRGTFRPGFLFNLARSLPAGLGAMRRGGGAGKRGDGDGKRSAGKVVP